MSDAKDPPDNVRQLGLIQGGKAEPDAAELNDVAITAAFAEFYRMSKAGQIAEFAVVILLKDGTSNSAQLKWGPIPNPSFALRGCISALATHLNRLLGLVTVTK